MIRLGAQLIRASVCKIGDPGSNPGPEENFSLTITTFLRIFYDLSKYARNILIKTKINSLTLIFNLLNNKCNLYFGYCLFHQISIL